MHAHFLTGYKMNIFQTEYYGNTVLTWAIVLGLILVSLVLGRFIYWTVGKYIKRLTAKTETDVDDVLIDKLEEPLIVLLTIVLIRLSTSLLTLPTGISTTISNGFVMVIAGVCVWAFLNLYESLHVTYIAKAVEGSETDLDDQLLPIVRRGIRLIVIALGAIIGLNNAGFDVGAVLAGLGIGGLAFALAAQDTVANFFGGAMLFIQQPFKVKDRVEVNGIHGYVDEIGLRSTKMRTIMDVPVLVPNKFFTEAAIYNYSQSPYYYKSTTLKLHRTTPLEKITPFLADIRTLTDRYEIINWMSPVFVGMTGSHYEIFVKIGVTKWNPATDPELGLGDYFAKTDLALNIVHVELVQMLEHHAIQLAIPFEVRYEVETATEQQVLTNGRFPRAAIAAD